MEPSPAFKKRGKRPPTASSSLLTLDSPAPALVEEASEEISAGSAVVFRKREPKTGARKSQNSAKLSFGAVEDDEEPTFIKKSSSSLPRRLLRAEPATSSFDATASAPAPAPSSSASSIYSKSYLSELKASTNSAPPPSAYDAATDMDVDLSMAGDQAEYDNLTLSRFGSSDGHKLVMDEDDDDEDVMRIGQQEQLIPSASSISSSKAFRERARQSGVPSTAPSTGFISLSLLPSSAIPKKESRLANSSDEEDGEDGIEGLLMPIGRKANKKAAEEMKKGLRELIDEGEAELEMGGPSTAAGREEEEEAREWEEAQIKRGEGRRFVPPPASSNGPSKPTSIPIPRPLPPLTSLLSTLSLQLTNLKAQHANDELAVEQFEKEKGVLAEQELELRGEVERVGRMSAFFGGMAKGGEGMRPWVEEMGNFLEAKFPTLEEVEKAELAITLEAYTLNLRGRYASDSDVLSLLRGEGVRSIPLVLPVVDEPEMIEPPFGPMRLSRRLLPTPPPAPLSFLTPSQHSDLVHARSVQRASLLALAADVLDPQFLDPYSTIQSYFTNWSNLYPDSYDNAYASLGLVGIVEYWVRAELLLWGSSVAPLAQFSMQEFAWFTALSAFEDSEELIARVVETVFIPRVKEMVRNGGVDIFDEAQSVALARVLEECRSYVDLNSRNFQALVQVLLTRYVAEMERMREQLWPVATRLLSSNPWQLSLASTVKNPVEYYALRNTFIRSRLLPLLRTGGRWRGISGGRGARLTFGEDEGLGRSWEGILLEKVVTGLILPFLVGEQELGGGGGGKELLLELRTALKGWEIGGTLDALE